MYFLTKIKKNISYKIYKKYLHIAFTFIALTLSSICMTSCDAIESPVIEAETYSKPIAVNQYALDKETEESTVEPTSAHHPYDEEYKLKPEKEIAIQTSEFLTKINYIKNHMDEFANTTIVIEGMYGKYTSWDGTFSFPMVYRNGPSCCGDDQYGGFFLVNIDESTLNLDDWIEVKGKPFNYEHTDSEGEVFNYPFILVESVRVLSTRERKAEMVND